MQNVICSFQLQNCINLILPHKNYYFPLEISGLCKFCVQRNGLDCSIYSCFLERRRNASGASCPSLIFVYSISFYGNKEIHSTHSVIFSAFLGSACGWWSGVSFFKLEDAVTNSESYRSKSGCILRSS